MGRHSQGYCNTNQAFTLDLSALVKARMIRQGFEIFARSWVWTNNNDEKVGEVSIGSILTENEKHIHLKYNFSYQGENPTDYDYKIQMVATPSNLGKGEVLFFICPASGRKCRKLYMAYNSPIFKCRQAYKTRIYYPAQQSSKLMRESDRYWHFKGKIKKMKKKRTAKMYAGKVTKRAVQLYRLQQKRDDAEWQMWMPVNLPLRLRRVFEAAEIHP